jgi:L-ascorbate metabolism protein UlaG (beta-lactamase superfamily)
MGLDRDTTITWYGHSCFGLQTPGGKAVLFDPYFDNPKSPMPADSVGRCDVLLVSHGHDDHLGSAVALASRLRPIWPCIHELSLWLSRRLPGGSDAVIGFNKGGTVTVAGLNVTMVHAEHSAGAWHPGGETTLYLGEPVGFIVELENGFRLYFAGDTAVFSDMRLIGELYRPELAFLPIGGHYTMGPKDAAMAVELLGVKHAIPMHYGTYPLLAGTPDEFRSALAARGLGDVQVHAPEPGGTVG